MARRALLIAICLLAAGCSTGVFEPRPATRGFMPESGVVAPYDDGKRHLAAGRYGVAIERFNQALASDRGSLDALNGLAIAYTRLGRFDVGQAYFERALEIDAFSAATLNNYGRALIEQGRLRDARPFLQLALHHAARADLTVIEANFGSIRSTEPPALVAALRETAPAPASDGRRLIRLAANRYRLETPRAARPPRKIVVQRPTALNVRPRRQPPVPVLAPYRPARNELATGPSVVLAGGADGLGIALASAADLEALGLGRDAEFAAVRQTLPPRPSTAGHAPTLASGEPT
jgi:tetratricopeptide (TPR) repeat protein